MSNLSNLLTRKRTYRKSKKPEKTHHTCLRLIHPIRKTAFELNNHIEKLNSTTTPNIRTYQNRANAEIREKNKNCAVFSTLFYPDIQNIKNTNLKK